MEAVSRSDGGRELVEGHAELVAGRDVGAEFVVAAAGDFLFLLATDTADVLHERVAGGQDPHGPVPFQAGIGLSRAFSRP
jgi:hypothetical protein